MIKIINELKDIFTSSDIKQVYIDNGKNPLSANYYIRSLIDKNEVTKIQNGLYYKKEHKFVDGDLNDLFKNKNDREFQILSKEKFDSFNVTNAVSKKNHIFVKSGFYDDNINLFKFIKEQKLADILIIPNKWNNDVKLNEYINVFVVKYTIEKDEFYWDNAFKLIKRIPEDRIMKICRDLRLTNEEMLSIIKIKLVKYG